MFNQLWKSFKNEVIGKEKVFNPVSSSIYYGRMSDAEIEDMRKRYEAAIKRSIEKMDSKWILHASHRIKRLA
jgi:hypothetical protein